MRGVVFDGDDDSVRDIEVRDPDRTKCACASPRPASATAT